AAHGRTGGGAGVFQGDRGRAAPAGRGARPARQYPRGAAAEPHPGRHARGGAAVSRASANAGPAARPLAELTAGFAAVPADVLVSDVTLDSRTARPGALFLACRGRTHHGLEFALDAYSPGRRGGLFERGAVAGQRVRG